MFKIKESTVVLAIGVLSSQVYAADYLGDTPIVVGVNPTTYKSMGQVKSELDMPMQAAQLTLPGLKAIEVVANSPNPTPGAITAAAISDKSGLSVIGGLGTSSISGNSPTPITDAAAKNFADEDIQAANALTIGSDYKALLNPSALESFMQPGGTPAFPLAKKNRAAIAEIFVRRAEQIDSVQYSYVWHEALAENDSDDLNQAKKSLQNYQAQIKQLQNQIRQLDAAIAKAQEICSLLPPDGNSNSDCGVDGLTKQKEAAQAKLNSQPVQVPGGNAKTSAKGLIAAANYLEKTFIPNKTKAIQKASAASKRASDLLTILASDPIQPAQSPDALKNQVAFARKRLREGVTDQAAWTAKVDDDAIADGSTPQIIAKLGSVIQSMRQLMKDDPMPAAVGRAMTALGKPYFSDPRNWTFAEAITNIIAMSPFKVGSVVTGVVVGSAAIGLDETMVTNGIASVAANIVTPGLGSTIIGLGDTLLPSSPGSQNAKKTPPKP